MARSLYLDASAIVKLVVREQETEALRAFIAGADLVSSEIAEIEVPRAAYLRSARPATLARARDVLAEFDLVAIDEEVRSAAARARPAELRSLDAVHLVSCQRLAAHLEAVVCYDRRLAAALRAGSLRVEAPGSGA